MSAAAKLAALLRRRKDEVIERWARRVLEDPRVPQANRLPQPTLHDHIPSLLDRLFERLEHAGNEPQAAEALGALLGDEHDSHAHAAQRASLGYDVNAASREIGHLRLVLLQVCAEEKLDLDITAGIVLHAALDEVMATLVERLERMSVSMARKHAEEGGARLLAAEQRQNAQLRALAEAAVAVVQKVRKRVPSFVGKAPSRPRSSVAFIM